MLHSQKIKSERGRGRRGGEGRKRWNENEKVGQESGVEKVNNGRTEEIAMEDWLRIWKDVNLYRKLKKKLSPLYEIEQFLIVRSHLFPPRIFFILSIVTVSNSAL